MLALHGHVNIPQKPIPSHLHVSWQSASDTNFRYVLAKVSKEWRAVNTDYLQSSNFTPEYKPRGNENTNSNTAMKHMSTDSSSTVKPTRWKPTCLAVDERVNMCSTPLKRCCWDMTH